MTEPLSQVLILLASSVFLVTLARRLGPPTTLGYLVVGLALGPHALGVVSDSDTTRLLAELGVAFLLFTLGLEFSLPRMIAMRREVLRARRRPGRRDRRRVRAHRAAVRARLADGGRRRRRASR